MMDSRQWSKEVQQQGEVVNLQENVKGKIGFTNQKFLKKGKKNTHTQTVGYWIQGKPLLGLIFYWITRGPAPSLIEVGVLIGAGMAWGGGAGDQLALPLIRVQGADWGWP